MNIISKTMLFYVLNGQRNLGLANAKIVAKKTGTDVMVWLDPAKVLERREAWNRTFPKKRSKSSGETK